MNEPSVVKYKESFLWQINCEEASVQQLSRRKNPTEIFQMYRRFHSTKGEVM